MITGDTFAPKILADSEKHWKVVFGYSGTENLLHLDSFLNWRCCTGCRGASAWGATGRTRACAKRSTKPPKKSRNPWSTWICLRYLEKNKKSLPYSALNDGLYSGKSKNLKQTQGRDPWSYSGRSHKINDPGRSPTKSAPPFTCNTERLGAQLQCWPRAEDWPMAVFAKVFWTSNNFMELRIK